MTLLLIPLAALDAFISFMGGETFIARQPQTLRTNWLLGRGNKRASVSQSSGF